MISNEWDDMETGVIDEFWTTINHVETGVEYLSHGLEWVNRVPYLHLIDIDAPKSLLHPICSRFIGFAATSEAKYCLGCYVMPGGAAIRPSVCPDQAPAESSGQCARCAARDEFRFVHHAHSGRQIPAALEQYLRQKHWLYVATLADGSSKVGTAADVRKYSRIDEQGVFAASYVASASDGKSIRTLEDAISGELGIPQRASRSKKLQAMRAPLPIKEVSQRHASTASEISAVLEDRRPGCTVSERWEPPEAYRPLLDLRSGNLYKESLREGQHGFFVEGCAGPFGLVRLHESSTVQLLMDFSETKGVRLTFGDYESGEHPVQMGMF